MGKVLNKRLLRRKNISFANLKEEFDFPMYSVEEILQNAQIFSISLTSGIDNKRKDVLVEFLMKIDALFNN
jgi:hypothetical protein